MKLEYALEIVNDLIILTQPEEYRRLWSRKYGRKISDYSHNVL